YSTNEYIINDCIYIELGVYFKHLEELDEVLTALEVVLIRKCEINYDLLLNAWMRYLKKKTFVCPSCRKTILPVCPECRRPQSFRQRILTDFFIGAFAAANSDGILTLDPQYYKNYFPDLTILE
ncbi:MAG: hypothetical protein GY850_30030, partial [bacterium]|nr:hypothetical protein [bacterium]